MSFASPEWDNDALGDKTHGNLFQKNNTQTSRKRKLRKNILKKSLAKLNTTESQSLVTSNITTKNAIKRKFKQQINKQIPRLNKIKTVAINTVKNRFRRELKNTKIQNSKGKKNISRGQKTEDKESLIDIDEQSNNLNDNGQQKNTKPTFGKTNKKVLKKNVKRLQNGNRNKKADSNIEPKPPKKNKKSEQNTDPSLMKNKLLGLNIETLRNKLSGALKADLNPSATLRERMQEKLRAARFRFLNEEMYTNQGKDAQKLFQSDPEAFDAYHEGYRQQVARWPLNPLDTIIEAIKKLPSDYVIADFGCGDARLARSVTQKVHSFDFVAVNSSVTACDMSKVPLRKNSVDVAVFCLSLMGTNLKDYLAEANRVLKIDGILKIAEVESRFEGEDVFIQGLQRYGFTNTWKDLSHNLFYFMDFKKERDIKYKNKLPTISLNPCLYKKR